MVVIAIIGILIALLSPAIQAARESAQRNQCQNILGRSGGSRSNEVGPACSVISYGSTCHCRSWQADSEMISAAPARTCRWRWELSSCLAMVHQLMLSASKRWRMLNGYELLPDVIQGIQFINGVKSQEVAA